MEITYGNVTRDFDKLPQASVKAILQRGLTHFLGNEQASKLVGKIESGITDGWTEAQVEAFKSSPRAERKQAFESFRLNNADLVSGWNKEILDSAVAALDAGTVGASVRGPSVDPLERQMEIIARKGVVTTLGANGIKTPKGDEVVVIGGLSLTMSEMIARRLANPKYAPDIEKQARKVIADQAKAIEKAKAEVAKAKEGGEVSAEDLGI